MRIINHENFISNRYDILIRYHFLRLAKFNIKEADRLYRSEKYKFLDLILERVGFFGAVDAKKKGVVRSAWKYINDMIRDDKEWLKYNPYCIAQKDERGLSTKRFLLAVKHSRTLYWISVSFYKGYSREKWSNPKWKKQTYIKELTTEQIDMFATSEKQLLHEMDRLNFFSKATKIGEWKNNELRLSRSGNVSIRSLV